jgi:acyl-CoA thioesterase-1
MMAAGMRSLSILSPATLLILTCAAGAGVTFAQPPARAAESAKTADAKNTRPVLVVFGDSLSAGYGLQPGQSFPDQLQRKLDAENQKWRVVNLGISGDTTQGGVARMAQVAALKPAIVVLELGGNDGLRGLPMSMTKANLDKMIVTFQSAGAKVVLAGMTLPPNYGMDYVHSFENVYKDLAAKYKLPLIPFLLKDIVTADLKYFQADGIHPTAPGAVIVADTVLRTLKPLLATAAPAK